MRETHAPVKKATYNAPKTAGKPRNKPIKKANLTSPNPIPLPLVIKNRVRKNRKEPIADNVKFRIKNLESRIKNRKEITTAGKTILSGIMPCLRSIKKIAISEDIMYKINTNSIAFLIPNS